MSLQDRINVLAPRPFVTVIMAAGKGKRMLNPELPKVMHKLNDKPMVDHVVDLAKELNSISIIAIVGFGRESVMNHLREVYGDSVKFAIQAEQLGTGHAVMQTEKILNDFDGDVLVLSGDVPLLTLDTMRKLLNDHWQTGAVMTVLTAKIDDPTGYGRIIRLSGGSVERIVEEKDATPDQRKVKEINSGIYAFRCKELFDALLHIDNSNVQREYYLTDVMSYFVRSGKKVSAVLAKDFDEIRGVNTVAQLEEIERTIRDIN